MDPTEDVGQQITALGRAAIGNLEMPWQLCQVLGCIGTASQLTSSLEAASWRRRVSGSATPRAHGSRFARLAEPRRQGTRSPKSLHHLL